VLLDFVSDFTCTVPCLNVEDQVAGLFTERVNNIWNKVPIAPIVDFMCLCSFTKAISIVDVAELLSQLGFYYGFIDCKFVTAVFCVCHFSLFILCLCDCMFSYVTDVRAAHVHVRYMSSHVRLSVRPSACRNVMQCNVRRGCI